MHRLTRFWYSRNPLALALWPFSLLFRGAAAARRGAYSRGLLAVRQVGAPVIVVGNITVGGSGKTPLVIYLAECLRRHGFKPGIVSRGYGGRSRHWPRAVDAASDPFEVGDEPVLIARRSGCPVAVAPDRVAAAQCLLAAHACDVVIADDGLQHYALARTIEIAVIDGRRGLGNGFCLPAGPLREPPTRLRSVDYMVSSGAAALQDTYALNLDAACAVQLGDANRRRPLADWRSVTVDAVAGIGDPENFFQLLRRHGLTVIEHAFPDHHRFRRSDLEFSGHRPVLMTEKDAVKCETWACDRYWYVPLEASLDPGLEQRIVERLRRVTGRATTTTLNEANHGQETA